MFEWILALYCQSREALADGGIRNLIRKRVFWQRVLTPVEMDLNTLPAGNAPQSFDYQFTELRLEDLQKGKFSFTVPSREYKAINNIKKGWRDFAFVKDSAVIADVWCVTPRPGGNIITHPDLNMLNVTVGKKDAYAFDMFLDPAFRGKNLAVPIQRSLQLTLKSEGFQKVYGFYWDDNRPALWMHRMLKFKELPKRRVSRFFFLHISQPLHQSNQSSANVEKTSG